MNAIRGVVLQSTRRHTVVLTPDGQYVRVRRGNLPVGAEVSVPMSGWSVPRMALAACVVLLLAFVLAQIPAVIAPAAYVALDINPGVILSLDGSGRVTAREGLNADGVNLLKQADPQGLDVRDALDLLIVEALAAGYLSPQQDNVILVSVAGREGFGISGDDVRAAVAEVITTLELDAYVVVSSVPRNEAARAKRDRVSVNALVVSRLLDEQGMAPAGPPAGVSELLKDIPPGRLFSALDFIPGRSGDRGRSGSASTDAGGDHRGPPDHAVSGESPNQGDQEQPGQSDNPDRPSGASDGRGQDDSREPGPPHGGNPPGAVQGPSKPPGPGRP